MTEYQKRWKEEHKEHLKAYWKDYYAKNRERRLEDHKRYYAEHREEMAVKNKKYALKMDKEKRRAYNRAWRLKHREEVLVEQKVYRMARKEGIPIEEARAIVYGELGKEMKKHDERRENETSDSTGTGHPSGEMDCGVNDDCGVVDDDQD